MKRTDFCRGWTRRLWGVPGDALAALPQDYSQQLPRSESSRSGSAGGWFQGANIIYDKEILVTREMLSRRLMLEFEGVFPNAEVYLDDALIARQPCGYFSFLADLTPRLRPGTQKIRVNVHGDALPNSRWYVGTGICRPVWLLQSPGDGIEPWGIRVRTRQTEKAWRLNAAVWVTAEAVRRGDTLLLILEDDAGNAVYQTETPVTAPCVSVEAALENIRAWTPDTPALYRLTALLRAGKETVDSAAVSVGFREVRLDGERGLLLNGEPVKLRGGCVHHDNGLLGAASLRDAEYLKAKRLKDFGYNAVRCAHNPPAPAFLDACDELGLMVMDEFADMWNIGKNPYDYHLHFHDRWRQDLESMIRRDWNHPSVILWSIGNEIPERDGSGNGCALCREMCDAVRELDDTRLVTAALNNIGRRRLDMLAANVQTDDPDSVDYFGILSEKFLSPLDVAGYNYLVRRYEKDLEAYPGRFICGTESVAREALECWRKTLAHPRVIGDFAWAAIDYLGEAGIGHVWRKPGDGEGFFEKWPWRQANCADIDLCGSLTPAGYYRKAVWGTLDWPFIAVQHPAHYRDDGDVSYWAWPERYSAWDYPGWEGKPVRVEVYSASPGVTLLLNGREIGTAPCRDCIATFDLEYTPGTLEAVDAGERAAALRTPGPAARLQLTACRVGSLAFVTARLADAEGNPCYFDDREIRFSSEGGEILAAGSADPASGEEFCHGKARAYHGQAAAAVLIREDSAVVSAGAEGLAQEGTAKIFINI